MEVSPLLTDPLVLSLSSSYGKSPAQILLKWALSKGYSVLPKSTNERHIDENVQLDFAISNVDMDKLDGLEQGKKYAWDPKVVI